MIPCALVTNRRAHDTRNRRRCYGQIAPGPNQGVNVSVNSIARALLVVLLIGATTASAGVNEFTITGSDRGTSRDRRTTRQRHLVLAGTARGIHRSTNGGGPGRVVPT